MTVSIVMEWENIFLTERSRTFIALQELLKQVELLFEAQKTEKEESSTSKLGFPIELIFSYPDKLDGDTIQGQVNKLCDRLKHLIKVVFVASKHVEYFGLKNDGAAAATGEIITYLDSDVIPQNNWLIETIASFEDPSVNVVGGTTYIDRDNIYTKAFGLIKFHMPVDSSSKLIRSYYIFANNFAFRSSFRDRVKFPPISSSFKLPITQLVQKLAREGITIYRNTRAIVKHPTPLYKNFLTRAFYHGRDEFILRRERVKSKSRASNKTRLIGGKEKKLLGNKLRRISSYNEIGISHLEFPLVMLLVIIYYTAAAFGFAFTWAFPRWSEKFNYLSMLE